MRSIVHRRLVFIPSQNPPPILFSKFILPPRQIYFITWWKYFRYFTSSTEFNHFYKFLTEKLADILVHAFIVIYIVLCPYVASSLQKYESHVNFVLIEIRSFPQPVSYLWGLDLKSFCISLAFNTVTNDARFVSGIWGCFGSLWSGNRRRQWWRKIGFFRLSFCCTNFVSCSFLLVRSVTGFDVISFIGWSILINISN